MGIAQRALYLLFPRGRIWNLVEDAARLIDGVSMSLDRIKDLIRQTEAEAIPGTAIETLPEWHEALGVQYGPTVPVAKQRALLQAIYTAEGNSTREGLRVQLEKEYPGLAVTEDSDFGYSVDGTVETETDALRVGSILSHFAPLHLVPTVFGHTAATTGNPNPVPPVPGSSGGAILSLIDETNICGVALCGVAVCGAESA